MVNLPYYLGLFASICVAVAGQAELIPEPYRHWVSLLGIIGTAVNGYLIQRPVPEPAAIKVRDFTEPQP